MRYITLEELQTKIKTNVLNDVTNEDYSMLDNVEDEALAEVTANIGHYYDMDLEFTLKGTVRNGFLVKLVIDLMIYELFTRMGPAINQTRQDRYDKATQWLQDISSGKLSANLPVKNPDLEETSHEGGVIGGSKPRNNYYW